MFLCFENWAGYTTELDKRGIEHEGIIVKVYASPIDPRECVKDERAATIHVIEVDHSEFSNKDSIKYNNTVISGPEIEQELSKKGFEGMRLEMARALLRFANPPYSTILSVSHELKDGEGEPLIKESFLEIIHRNGIMHLDIFAPRLVEEFRKEFFDPEPRSELFVTKKEGGGIRREINALREKESYKTSPET